MKSPIRIDDIEEFEAVKKIPRASITENILAGVRQLYEIEQIEPFLRQILSDPNETPHTSTEIADILTTLTYGGQSYLSAFVNKGKSYSTVKPTDVSHQFLKLKRISDLGLMVLLAVGNILDEVKEHFLSTAKDQNARYMIVDVVDVARLFIAYHKICPKDGIPYTDGKCEKCGTAASEPIELTLKIHEEPHYTILSLDDKSHGSAKRYSADILTNPHYSKATLREVIKKAIWQLRKERYYRSERIKKQYGDKDADIVFLYVFLGPRDVQQYNWVCQATWIDSDLPAQARPWQHKIDEFLGEIGLEWKSNYEHMRDFWLRQEGTKEEWLQKVEALFTQTEKLFEQTNRFLVAYDNEEIERDEFERNLEQLESQAKGLLFEAGDRKVPPLDCEKCDEIFYAMMGIFYDIFLPFGNIGQAKWDLEQKLEMMESDLQRYIDYRNRFLYEWQELRR